MARFPAIRKGNALVPSTQDGRDELNKIDHGQDVIITVTRARRIRQHNLFWKLCEVLADHFDVTKDAIKDELCERTGHVEPIFYSDGSMRLRPKSIAFENMPQDHFEAFFRLATNKAVDMLGAAPQDVLDHIFSLLEQHSAPSIAPDQERERARERA